MISLLCPWKYYFQIKTTIYRQIQFPNHSLMKKNLSQDHNTRYTTIQRIYYFEIIVRIYAGL